MKHPKRVVLKLSTHDRFIIFCYDCKYINACTQIYISHSFEISCNLVHLVCFFFISSFCCFFIIFVLFCFFYFFDSFVRIPMHLLYILTNVSCYFCFGLFFIFAAHSLRLRNCFNVSS